MGEIGPARTAEELASSAEVTYDGKGSPGLPGVTSDALTMDKEAYIKNGELAEEIKKVFAKAKGSSPDGKPLFVLGWRMYTNADNPYWKDRQAQHKCGCTCGCSTHHKKRPHPGGG